MQTENVKRDPGCGLRLQMIKSLSLSLALSGSGSRSLSLSLSLSLPGARVSQRAVQRAVANRKGGREREGERERERERERAKEERGCYCVPASLRQGEGTGLPQIFPGAQDALHRFSRCDAPLNSAPSRPPEHPMSQNQGTYLWEKKE